MNNPYDVHAWSKQYREDVVQEVQTRRLEKQARVAPAGTTCSAEMALTPSSPATARTETTA